MIHDAIPLVTIRRALVIKLRHHGDVLLASPVFSVLKAQVPGLEVDALVYADTAPMLTHHPAIAQIHTIDRHQKKHGTFAYLRAEWALLRALRGRHYDLIVHLTDHPRGAWVARLCRARWAVTRKIEGRGWWWTGSFTHFFRSPLNARRHTAELNLDALRRIGVFPADGERRLTLIAGNEAQARVGQLLHEAGLEATPFIHIHPASRWFFKCWTAAKMAALIDCLHAAGHRVVLSAAPETNEMAMIAAIQARAKKPADSLAGQLSLKELAALTARARLFIGVDSAPMHIAAAMGTPTVALFGPSGDQEWGPWGVAHRIVASDDHPCRPCGIDGCGGSKVSDCLTSLSVDRVWNAAQELLAQ